MSKKKGCTISNCHGCRDDYYNKQDNGPCWSLASAELVTRYQLGWWDDPTVKRNYTKVTVPNCYRRPGAYAYMEKIQAGAK